ncbi:isoamylase early set domain-containing protein [Allosalinactinospora lopnorensis]|uniref:isoamylase early set domain-containing protein n=1 Tax=Allosalinactinospora lopnorensis TaxID=1352348 RepID=UPI000623ED70|nr:isoamylase early set domain-containing protein [Allosalinactinospora lopnorensis]
MIKRGKPSEDGRVKVTFMLPAQEPPGQVSLVGSFNDWDPHIHPLRARTNGRRSVVVSAPANSTLHFRYLGEDGLWFDDTDADELLEDGCRLHL